MKSANSTYYVTVIEDTETNQIIGAASLIFERKFIRECAAVSDLTNYSIIKHDYKRLLLFPERYHRRSGCLRPVQRTAAGEIVRLSITT